MFGRKKKPSKIDPRVRFRNKQFNQRLKTARTYKRPIRPPAESAYENFLVSIGLGSKWKRYLLVVVLAGLIYLVYFPNFLSIKKIEILGTDDNGTQIIEKQVEQYFQSTKIWNPQKNLVLLSKSELQQELKGLANVDSVISIKKSFKSQTLTISVLSKYSKFLVSVNDSHQVLDIYNDGTYKSVSGVQGTDWLKTKNENMLKVLVENGSVSNQDLHPGTRFFSVGLQQYLANIVMALNSSPISSSTTLLFVDIPQSKKTTVSTSGDVESSGEELKEVENSNNDSTASQDKSQNNELHNDAQESTINPEGVKDLVVDIVPAKLPLESGQVELVFQKKPEKSPTSQKDIFRVIVDTQDDAMEVIKQLSLLLSQTSTERYNGLSYIDLRVDGRAYLCLLGSACSTEPTFNFLFK